MHRLPRARAGPGRLVRHRTSWTRRQHFWQPTMTRRARPTSVQGMTARGIENPPERQVRPYGRHRRLRGRREPGTPRDRCLRHGPLRPGATETAGRVHLPELFHGPPPQPARREGHERPTDLRGLRSHLLTGTAVGPPVRAGRPGAGPGRSPGRPTTDPRRRHEDAPARSSPTHNGWCRRAGPKPIPGPGPRPATPDDVTATCPPTSQRAATPGIVDKVWRNHRTLPTSASGRGDPQAEGTVDGRWRWCSASWVSCW